MPIRSKTELAVIEWHEAHAVVAPRIPEPICECGHYRLEHSHGGGAYCEVCGMSGKCQRFRDKNKAERDALMAETRSIWDRTQAADAELRALATEFKGK